MSECTSVVQVGVPPVKPLRCGALHALVLPTMPQSKGCSGLEIVCSSVSLCSAKEDPI